MCRLSPTHFRQVWPEIFKSFVSLLHGSEWPMSQRWSGVPELRQPQGPAGVHGGPPDLSATAALNPAGMAECRAQHLND